MFPHACGVDLERAVRNGADPAQVVPDDYVVVRGGTKPLPPAGEEFSGFVGPEVAAAGCALPHAQIRVSSAGAIRAAGGRVTWVPEFSPHGTLNLQHVIKDASERRPAKPGSGKTETVSAKQGQPARLAFGHVAFKNGRVNFSDFFIKPNYSVDILRMTGTVSEMNPEKAGNVLLRNTRHLVDNGGPAKSVGNNVISNLERPADPHADQRPKRA